MRWWMKLVVAGWHHQFIIMWNPKLASKCINIAWNDIPQFCCQKFETNEWCMSANNSHLNEECRPKHGGTRRSLRSRS